MSNSSVEMFGRVPSRRARSAYTLLEVLVVIGIIALLVSILLAVLSKARETARRTACENNLQVIAKAILLYVNDNDGFFPFAAARKDDLGMGQPPEGHLSADWIYWQCGPNDKLPAGSVPAPQGNGLVIDDVDKGGIGKYLGCSDLSLSGLQMLRCPSDARLNNSAMGSSTPAGGGYPNMNGQSPYPFSYVLNAFMSSANFSTGNNPAVPPGCNAKTLAKVKDPGTKILVFEEDPRTIDDGNGALCPPNPTGGAVNMLSIRHDYVEIDDQSARNNGLDPVSMSVIPGTPPQLTISNSGRRGNVAFCDGHAEFIQRGTAHLKDYWAPDPSLFPSFP
ncbi:MAG TPA: type II secretion system protein [Tepidisphaeraceae bacterium]|nr:type II secretion system protein [Tepidisphaeraceae bacterium]